MRTVLPLLVLSFCMVLAAIAVTSGKRILVLCTGNSARSQMAQGFLRSFDLKLDVQSAGTAPVPRVNPYAVRAMKEIGIDISGMPKNVKQFLDQSFDYVITVCDDADQNCPLFRGKVGKRLHMGFPDPAKATGTDEEIMTVFRRVRDQIKELFTRFYSKEIKKAQRPINAKLAHYQA